MNQAKNIIPLRRSRMPGLADLEKYIKRIDKSKNYSNRSELVLEFENRISDYLGINEKNVIALSSGFSALSLGIMATANTASQGKFCIVPSFTFPGTISSILFAGLKPYFIDISPDDFCLSIDSVFEEFKGDFSQVACVVPVGTFGIKPNISEWKLFEDKTKVRVFYDLAWNFDNYPNSENINSMISLHASKVLGCGEGGIITLENSDMKPKILRDSNFGFDEDKRLETIGINAKMSEYHAAVGLAAMDIWNTTKELNLALQKKFIDFFNSLDNFTILQGLTKDFCWMSCVVYSKEKNINYLEKALEENNIESRRWWGNLCHESKPCLKFKRGLMDVSERMSKEHINIPFYSDMSQNEVEEIFKTIQLVDKNL